MSLNSIRIEKGNNFFLYSTVKYWNSLSELSRNRESDYSFKKHILSNIFYTHHTSKLFYIGNRYASIVHTRLRFNNCRLNYYLLLINCVESQTCGCGAPKEDVLIISSSMFSFC